MKASRLLLVAGAVLAFCVADAIAETLQIDFAKLPAGTKIEAGALNVKGMTVRLRDADIIPNKGVGPVSEKPTAAVVTYALPGPASNFASIRITGSFALPTSGGNVQLMFTNPSGKNLVRLICRRAGETFMVSVPDGNTEQKVFEQVLPANAERADFEIRIEPGAGIAFVDLNGFFYEVVEDVLAPGGAAALESATEFRIGLNASAEGAAKSLYLSRLACELKSK